MLGDRCALRATGFPAHKSGAKLVLAEPGTFASFHLESRSEGLGGCDGGARRAICLAPPLDVNLAPCTPQRAQMYSPPTLSTVGIRVTGSAGAETQLSCPCAPPSEPHSL